MTPDRKKIKFSGINNPIKTEEARLAGKTAFLCPDNKLISAIGEKKNVRTDSQGGSLIFSTTNNIYSIDVRGEISEWGEAYNSPAELLGTSMMCSSKSKLVPFAEW